ncbi:MAG: aminotransferase class I/II-fold pyridoxal phosphate-dependent enzyme, partial [Coleofasciculus sp. S288]|nr:aminotransferase class I/II-fold pyridoxal phosphate-dependent enzyme [Coleofasciculus sp. S288]
DQYHKITNAQKIKASRTHMVDALKQLGFQVWPSQANFLLASVTEASPPSNAESLYQILKQRGILVRYFKQPRLEDKLRITVGTPEQNEALINVLNEILT